MVSILPSARGPMDIIGADVGQALQGVLPGAVQQGYNRGQLQKSLSQIKDISANPSASNLDILLSTLQAGAGIPGSEKYMAAILPEIIKQAEANRAGKSSLAGESNQGMQQQQRNREPIEQPQQVQKLPEFGGNRFYPTNLGPEGGPGHIPQEATTGKKLPLLAPNEKPAAIKKLIADNKAVGRILTIPEASAEINANEEDKKAHNASVDKELAQQVNAQKNYGQQAVEQLHKVYKKSNPEIDAVFKKFGEEEATKGKSEADIERSLAIKAKNFSDAVFNIEKDLSAPRLLNSITRKLNGTYKDFEQSSKDIRSKLQPILELGLYDTARNLMSGLGYYPEEVDVTVNPLGEREKIALNKVPKNPTKQSKHPSFFSPESGTDLNNIKEGLIDLKQANPNFSLVLARKMFEDKGYDSRMFKDALNELEEQGFKLEDDQQRQRGILDTPPLDMLGQILSDINIRGR